MWKQWTKLSQANVDHYNEHPGTHNAAAFALAAVGVVWMGIVARKLIKDAEIAK